MISVSHLAMSYGQKILFEDVSLQFNAPNRYGLTGANGAGKSTFLRILSGEEEAAQGEVQIAGSSTLGFLKQDQDSYRDWQSVDVVLSGREHLWQAMQEKEKLLALPQLPEAKAEHLAYLEEIIHSEEGYSAAALAQELLAGLGLSQKMINGKMNALSGGYRLRVLLARVLFARPTITLLDEPTNHLDIVSIAWLEKFLVQKFEGVLILISHDRSFLNRVCTHIADVDFKTIRLYKGNYDSFVKARELALEQKNKEVESQEKKAAEMQAFVERFRAKASKARQAQSRVKQLQRLEIPEIEKSSRCYPSINFEMKRPSGKMALKVRSLCKSFGSRPILKNISFEIARGQKVAILGANGAGKSTLLKLLMQELVQDSGEITRGHEAYFSYFAQDHFFSENKSVFEWLYSQDPSVGISKIRSILGNLLFSQEEAEKKTSHLSGGESARLLLASLVLQKANVLVLDEPTNHLDMESVAELEKALAQFHGTVIFVSHDRSFVEKVATRIFSLRSLEDITSESEQENNPQQPQHNTVESNGFFDFQGTYAEYLADYGEDWLSASTLKKQNSLQHAEQNFSQKSEASDSQVPQKKGGLEYQKRKEQRSFLLKLEKAISAKEKEIQQSEKRLAQIEQTFAAGDIFLEGNHLQAQKLQLEKEQLQQKLASLLEEWESLHTQKENKQKTNT